MHQVHGPDGSHLSGFSPATRWIIIQRAQESCERCCRATRQVEIHHRRPRGMGGSKDPLTNTAANGVLLCTDCHRFVESHREEGLTLGWLVPQGVDPRTVPVLYQGSQYLYLATDGGMSRERT